jgi:hypothetical protein
MLNNINEYITADIYEATVLKYFGHKLPFVDKSEHRARFYFERVDQTDDILKSYRERVLQVEPYAFSQCMRDVKDRLYNG